MEIAFFIMRVFIVLIIILDNLYMVWRGLSKVSPPYHDTHTLTYYISNTYIKSSIAPNGSHDIWWGYASKWLHPP